MSAAWSAGFEVDVVVVSYNSAGSLRACVEPLSGIRGINVIVVDNASHDGSLETIGDLGVDAVRLELNTGFANGCNVGWHRGTSRYVLFLNPDATVAEESLHRLVDVLRQRPTTALVAPRIISPDGELQLSLRRFPQLRSTYAQAFYLHRLAPRASWVDEIVRWPEHYDRAGPQEWVSGACVLVRRSVLEQLGGWDDGFFLYCEDIDLCRRAANLGLEVYYEPDAMAVHTGSASAPRASTLPLLAASRVRYARIHRARLAAAAEAIGVGLEALGRVVFFRDGPGARRGHASATRIALSGSIDALRSRPPSEDRTDVLLVCSTGGHLLQLWALRSAWEGRSRAWVTFDKSDARSLLRSERVVHAHGPTNRSFRNLIRNTILARRVLRRLQPTVLVTTGAGVAVPFAWLARLRKIDVVYVESLSRIDEPSLSCRMIAPVAGRVYAQWSELAEAMPSARFVGSVFEADGL